MTNDLDTADRNVATARHHLDRIRRQRLAGHAGHTDVQAAEAQLGQALDRLHHVTASDGDQ